MKAALKGVAAISLFKLLTGFNSLCVRQAAVICVMLETWTWSCQRHRQEDGKRVPSNMLHRGLHICMQERVTVQGRVMVQRRVVALATSVDIETIQRR